jgi:hypothetical protein
MKAPSYPGQLNGLTDALAVMQMALSALSDAVEALLYNPSSASDAKLVC